jgi:hypothetical protein
MNAQLSHREAKSLFGPWIDQDLDAPKARQLKDHLDGCVDCRTGWTKYERVVRQARDLGREGAPPDLAGKILRRVRRRRLGARALHSVHMNYRVPVEVIVPPLIAVAIAALLYFASA